MKKLLLYYFLALPILNSAQTNFEGIITYRGTITSKIQPVEIKMFFADNKVKIKTIDLLSVNKSGLTQIYNFQTRIHYYIFEDEKAYTINSLDSFTIEDYNLKDTVLPEYIQGYYCKSYIEPERPLRNLFSMFWYPDSITFMIPEKYRQIKLFNATDEGNLLFLKMKTVLNFKIDKDDELVNNMPDTFTMVAEKIERMKVNEAEFLPPAGYTFSNYERPISRDSVRVRELKLTELKQEEDKKEPPPPPSPKTPKPLKTPAKKENGTKPVKG
jgi:hypothetical protein